jgi:hypothetical protein
MMHAHEEVNTEGAVMQHTGIVINKESWLMLRDEPLYSPRFITREDTNEVALVTRVEVLDFFLEVYPPLILDLETWCGSDNIWGASLHYRFRTRFGGSYQGVFYLNPRQRSDVALLRHVTQHETLTAVFLSEDCNEHYTVDLVHDPQALARWQQLVSSLPIEEALLDADVEDTTFMAAVDELRTKGET